MMYPAMIACKVTMIIMNILKTQMILAKTTQLSYRVVIKKKIASKIRSYQIVQSVVSQKQEKILPIKLRGNFNTIGMGTMLLTITKTKQWKLATIQKHLYGQMYQKYVCMKTFSEVKSSITLRLYRRNFRCNRMCMNMTQNLLERLYCNCKNCYRKRMIVFNYTLMKVMEVVTQRIKKWVKMSKLSKHRFEQIVIINLIRHLSQEFF